MVNALFNYLIVLLFNIATASSPAQQPQPFVTQQQATEAAPSSMKPAVYRPRPGRDVDRQALYNQWAFASPPHFYHQVPRQEAESKAASCAAVTEQLASKMEGKPPFNLPDHSHTYHGYSPSFKGHVRTQT